jgi:hypothetical protein
MNRVEYPCVMIAQRSRQRRSLIRFFGLLIGALVLTAPHSLRAQLEAESKAEPLWAESKTEPLWGFVPSIGVASSFISLGGNGSVGTSVLIPAVGSTPAVRRDVAGDENVDFAIYGLTLGLDSPRIPVLPFAPRVTARIGLASGIQADIDLARQDSPGFLQHPPGRDPRNVVTQPEVKGQGSAIAASFGSYFLNGNLGLGFDFPIADRTLRIRPSFEWTLFQMRLDGIVRHANRPSSPNRPLIDGTTGIEYPSQFINLDGLGRKQLGGIGPGLELELDAARFGPLVSAVSISGQAYRIYGHRERHLSNGFTDPATYNYAGTVSSATADWTAKFHRWTYRAGLALHLYWRPE